MSDLRKMHGNCPLARVMSILGEGWTLLVLREAFLGTRQFNQFEKELGVARNVLSARLRKLVEAGLLRRTTSTTDRRVVEYRLTEAGRSLFPVLVALSQWAMTALDDKPAPISFVERASGEELPPVAVRNRQGEILQARDVEMRPGPGADETLTRRYRRASAANA